MKTIDLSIENLAFLELIKLASEENIVLVLPDGREFILAELDDFDKEIALLRENDELWELLDERSRKDEKSYSLAEVRERIRLQGD